MTTTPDFAHAAWRKSRRSGDNGGQCVEVAFLDHAVGVRDSKHNGNGPILSFTHQDWHAFINAAKNGEFDRP